jgi:hypothetical protein
MSKKSITKIAPFTTLADNHHRIKTSRLLEISSPGMMIKKGWTCSSNETYPDGY